MLQYYRLYVKTLSELAVISGHPSIFSSRFDVQGKFGCEKGNQEPKQILNSLLETYQIKYVSKLMLLLCS